jgi:hypothetical protein
LQSAETFAFAFPFGSGTGDTRQAVAFREKLQSYEAERDSLFEHCSRPIGVTEFDEIIIGQGLAGTTLAWHLLGRGRRVLVIDRAQVGTSSRLAAGLITPITGQRLTVSWRCREFLEQALSFYRQIESRTSTSFLHADGALRFWQNDREQQVFARRLQEEPEFASLVDELSDMPDGVAADRGGFAMPTAARLNVPLFLDVSRAEFQRLGLSSSARESRQRTTPGFVASNLTRLGVRSSPCGFDCLRTVEPCTEASGWPRWEKGPTGWERPVVGTISKKARPKQDGTGCVRGCASGSVATLR